MRVSEPLVKHWIRKFANALRGIRLGIAGQSSFHVHIPAAVCVGLLAWWLNCSLVQWCLLGLCIALVMVSELMNSAIEYLARGLCSEHNPQVGHALDIASGAVLVASLAAALVGMTIFLAQALS